MTRLVQMQEEEVAERDDGTERRRKMEETMQEIPASPQWLHNTAPLPQMPRDISLQ